MIGQRQRPLRHQYEDLVGIDARLEQMQHSLNGDGRLARPGCAFQKHPAGAGNQVALLFGEFVHFSDHIFY